MLFVINEDLFILHIILFIKFKLFSHSAFEHGNVRSL